MNVTRFTARNSREALKKVKDALGPDALVLANRPCADGIEIIAAPASLLSAIEVPPAHATAAMPAAAAPAPQPPAAATDSDPLRRAARPALPEQPMSTVSFQDYVRQRLRDRQQGIVEPEDPAV
jgi:flagellar biosynthesis protein FlhF